MRHLSVLTATLLLACAGAWAQDPAAVDPEHYAVEFENDYVRVLRITYEPGDTSVMHYHPGGAAVAFTDQHVRFGLPDGTSVQAPETTAGQTWWVPAGHHLPENVGDEPLELILVEVKAATGDE